MGLLKSGNPGRANAQSTFRLNRLLLCKALGAFLCLLGLFRGHLLEGLCHLFLGAAGIELCLFAFFHRLLHRSFQHSSQNLPLSGFAARTPGRRPLTGGTNALTEMFRRKRLVAHQARALLALVQTVGLRFFVVVAAAGHGVLPHQRRSGVVSFSGPKNSTKPLLEAR